MPVSQFPCPHCSTTLRIRDRMFAGKVVGCPDCGRQLEIVADGPRHLTARIAPEGEQPANGEATAGRPDDAQSKSRDPSSRRKQKRKRHKQRKVAAPDSSAETDTPSIPVARRLLSLFKSPVTIAWVVAVLAAGTIVGLALNRNGNSNDVNPDDSRTIAKTEEKKTPQKLPLKDPWDINGDVDARLMGIARLLEAHDRRHGSFPQGTVPAGELQPKDRLSWIAKLAAASKRYGRRQPNWNRPWSDPLNEGFARQQIDLFRNPNWNAQPGADGMPVTHFVGVAGVGEDGPFLPANHPRAGIFAYNRVTRREDITDGLQHTMMIAGVQKNVGGWAVGGRSTIRPFTKGPYINGPDGFGTGDGDHMLVLMADGSVRKITRKTDPVIVRRMAAMADGFGPNNPGDPLDSLKKQKPPVVVKKKKAPPPKRRKRDPVVATRPRIDNVKRIDVEASLKQPVLRFENATPTPLRDLLEEVQELAGVPVRIDEKLLKAQPDLLDRRTTIKVENATVRDILQALLKNVGLTYQIEKDGIRITLPMPKAKADQ